MSQKLKQIIEDPRFKRYLDNLSTESYNYFLENMNPDYNTFNAIDNYEDSWGLDITKIHSQDLENLSRKKITIDPLSSPLVEKISFEKYTSLQNNLYAGDVLECHENQLIFELLLSKKEAKYQRKRHPMCYGKSTHNQFIFDKGKYSQISTPSLIDCAAYYMINLDNKNTGVLHSSLGIGRGSIAILDGIDYGKKIMVVIRGSGNHRPDDEIEYYKKVFNVDSVILKHENTKNRYVNTQFDPESREFIIFSICSETLEPFVTKWQLHYDKSSVELVQLDLSRIFQPADYKNEERVVAP